MAALLRGVRRVVVGMSGGVDSTVSALLLQRRGYEVVGVLMRNWDGRDETGHCEADREMEEAAKVADKLGINFLQVDLVKEYWTEVFQDMVEGYRLGLTPNPDVLCNSRVKFKHFLDFAVNSVGCDAIATGHYARNSFGEGLEGAEEGVGARLLKAVDRTKDQTFFLSQMPQEALRVTMFPVGELTKPVVKEIARQAGFADIADKKESMGICFVGKKVAPGGRGFQEFISEYVEAKEGPLVHIDTGEEVGRHQGLHHWTIGQRVGINRDDKSYHVVSRDVATNVIQVADDAQHPALYSESFYTGAPHWIAESPEGLRAGGRRMVEVEFRFQNMAPLTQCVVSFAMKSTTNWESVDPSRLVVSVAEPLRAVSPGQFAAFYQGDVCLGSARIRRPGPSLYTLNSGGCRTAIAARLAGTTEPLSEGVT